MSLKAKIEAVIYASEEPVTLAQLMGLLGQEAQAELDRIDSAQQTLALDADTADRDTVDPDELNSEVLSAEGDGETDVQAEAERVEALERHLHEAVAEEAEHLREAREHEAADAAAMSTGDDLDPVAEAGSAAPELMEGSAPVKEGEASAAEETAQEGEVDGAADSGAEGGDAPAAGSDAPVSEDGVVVVEAVAVVAEAVDEKKLAREAKEKERRLRDYFRSLMDQLVIDYATSDRGMEIREVAGGYRFATKPEYHDAVRGFVKSLKPALKLSLQALETLAVVAYKQPVTAPEVSEIRGVDSGGVLGSLMSRKLVATAGRKQVIGRPILYKTTKEFLLRFGLKDINELPSIEEFERMAGELAEQEEIPMEHHAPESPDEVEVEKGVSEPQADGDSSPDESVSEEVIVEESVSGPPPADHPDAVEDSPALDAEIQEDARRESEEG